MPGSATPPTDGTRPPRFRSPFVARLVANAMLDGLMQWMRDAGIEASLSTMAALQALRCDIDRRVDQTVTGAGPLEELVALSDRLVQLRCAMPGPPTPD